MVRGNPELTNEIIKNVNTIPIEYQEHILDIMKAMVFTRKVILRRQIRDECGKIEGQL